MKRTFQAAYLPIGTPTFHLESAQQEFEKSALLLKKLLPDVVCPSEMLLTLDKVRAACDSLTPDLLIV